MTALTWSSVAKRRGLFDCDQSDQSYKGRRADELGGPAVVRKRSWSYEASCAKMTHSHSYWQASGISRTQTWQRRSEEKRPCRPGTQIISGRHGRSTTTDWPLHFSTVLRFNHMHRHACSRLEASPAFPSCSNPCSVFSNHMRSVCTPVTPGMWLVSKLRLRWQFPICTTDALHGCVAWSRSCSITTARILNFDPPCVPFHGI